MENFLSPEMKMNIIKRYGWRRKNGEITRKRRQKKVYVHVHILFTGNINSVWKKKGKLFGIEAIL